MDDDFASNRDDIKPQQSSQIGIHENAMQPILAATKTPTECVTR